MMKAPLRTLFLVLAALGAAWWIDQMIMLEWSYPYCSVLDNGEAAAVFGFPLPYREVFIAGSATTSFIPGLYAINLAAIAAGIFLLIAPVASRLRAWKPLIWNLTIGAAAGLLLVPAVALETFAISIGVSFPSSSFSSTGYGELRPVAVHVLGGPRNCTASPFWFPREKRGLE